MLPLLGRHCAALLLLVLAAAPVRGTTSIVLPFHRDAGSAQVELEIYEPTTVGHLRNIIKACFVNLETTQVPMSLVVKTTDGKMKQITAKKFAEDADLVTSVGVVGVSDITMITVATNFSDVSGLQARVMSEDRLAVYRGLSSSPSSTTASAVEEGAWSPVLRNEKALPFSAAGEVSAGVISSADSMLVCGENEPGASLDFRPAERERAAPPPAVKRRKLTFTCANDKDLKFDLEVPVEETLGEMYLRIVDQVGATRKYTTRDHALHIEEDGSGQQRFPPESAPAPPHLQDT